ncbi:MULTISPECIES: cbb3-type cytochrome oxidase subunit 3 [Cupriavidus]|jgi:cytochrome c oxidase cbb3-type subunit 4|uniref:CcoQ/FixQ family Cbb3-type cytochrome c oxidase assembly chaperone n=1 Tax=Cupriavidus pauculus TaxID=82633 RepID=A0A5P2H1V8_9BURK|nr:CcoQ/FixQ family Cbb3-type cytochrome c oxidase assembly chaperone [Cupriavidus pauculus]QET01310.1 CcoQ/FixQ family Cbb3-type cytochrome c oxidase assembly chaperone [Cupriavidus pauculus]
MAMLTAIATVISMVVFLGICWWAWSAHRQAANLESALLPFALPDETTTRPTTSPDGELRS